MNQILPVWQMYLSDLFCTEFYEYGTAQVARIEKNVKFTLLGMESPSLSTAIGENTFSGNNSNNNLPRWVNFLTYVGIFNVFFLCVCKALRSYFDDKISA